MFLQLLMKQPCAIPCKSGAAGLRLGLMLRKETASYRSSSTEWVNCKRVVNLVCRWLILSIWSALIVQALGEFTEQDLSGPYVRRYGLSACPSSLYFDSSSLNLTATSLVVNGQDCTSGEFRVSLSPRSAPSGGELAEYLSASPGVGELVGIEVVDPLQCPSALFEDRAYFVLTKTEQNVTVDWRVVFSRNDTVLQSASDSSTYIFVAGVAHIVINSLCLYSTLTEEEFDRQRGEACFSRGALVATSPGGTRKIEQLRKGDVVTVSADKHHSRSPVVGWTHYNPTAISPFVCIIVGNGRVLHVSPGHFVYANDRLLPARLVRPGMRMRMMPPPDSLAVSVSHVWRVGLYNPQTKHGDIVVNGFICSTYTEAVAPLSAHALLAPVRLLSTVGIDVLAVIPWFHNLPFFFIQSR